MSLDKLMSSLGAVFLQPASLLSVWVLGFALLLAAGWYAMSRRRVPSLRFLRRALFPRGYLTSPSARADQLLTFLNFTLFGMAGLGAIFAVPDLAGVTHDGLIRVTGRESLLALEPLPGRMLATLILFLAYEWAYYFDHWLCHRVPFLWEFHKVHHTATSLSPLTVYRVHPVDGYLYFAIASTTLGVVGGASLWLLGPVATPFVIDGQNAVLFVFMYFLMTLHHSQVWIAFGGKLGQAILSPAHHQLHHSADPAHYGCNLGNVLAVWDKAFGTLRLPERESPRLRFGCGDLGGDPHSVSSLLATPMIDAMRTLAPAQRHEPTPDALKSA